MRNPARIKAICDALATEWSAAPDQRLGQFLQNYVFGRGDIFFQEDDDTMKQLGVKGVALIAEDPDVWTDTAGLRTRVHAGYICKGQSCAMHNPSSHPMRGWPNKLNASKGWLLQRQCSHGLWHPDPDSLDYYMKNASTKTIITIRTHECDGCCQRGA